MIFPIVVPMTISATETTIPLEVSTNQVSIDTSIGMQVNVVAADVYRGDYTFTPTTATQTVQIANQMATSNITINPIPNNYGLIEWDGTRIRVS